MAKVKTFLRIAKGKKGFRVIASPKPSNQPIEGSMSRFNQTEILPTIAFAIILDIPDELFNQAEKVVAEIKVNAKNGIILGEVDAVAQK